MDTTDEEIAQPVDRNVVRRLADFGEFPRSSSRNWFAVLGEEVDCTVHEGRSESDTES